MIKETKESPELIKLIESYYVQSRFNHQVFENATARYKSYARALKWGSILTIGASISLNIFNAPTSSILNNILGAIGLILNLVDSNNTSAKESVKCGEKAGDYLRLRDDLNLLLYEYRGGGISEEEAWRETRRLVKRYEDVSVTGPQSNKHDYRKTEKFFKREKKQK